MRRMRVCNRLCGCRFVFRCLLVCGLMRVLAWVVRLFRRLVLLLLRVFGRLLLSRSCIVCSRLFLFRRVIICNFRKDRLLLCAAPCRRDWGCLLLLLMVFVLFGWKKFLCGLRLMPCVLVRVCRVVAWRFVGVVLRLIR